MYCQHLFWQNTFCCFCCLISTANHFNPNSCERTRGQGKGRATTFIGTLHLQHCPGNRKLLAQQTVKAIKTSRSLATSLLTKRHIFNHNLKTCIGYHNVTSVQFYFKVQCKFNHKRELWSHLFTSWHDWFVSS